MAVQRMTYLLDSVPDPAYPLYRFRAGGDVRSALRDDAGHLLRTFAAFPPGSASLSLQLYYKPASAGENHGVRRLSVSLSGQAFSPAAAASLKLLLESGPLQRFYRLVPGDPVITPELPAACSVVRRQELLPATVTAEFNAKALSVYYAATPFEAREENDYMLLDGVLDPLSEPALVTIDISPAAIGHEAAAHTRYLSLLQQVNHVFSLGDDDLFAPRGGEWRDAARPLHVREPLVDELLQQQRRFHETLRQPHLRFRITVSAQSLHLAQLLASVVGEAAFENGSYELLKQAAPQEGKALSDGSLPGRIAELYETLWQLGTAATPDELLGVFRLPAASVGSPCCIPRNTDPPSEASGDLLIMGHDDQGSGGSGPAVVRGLPPGQLAKHLFVSGMPGSGKTTAV